MTPDQLILALNERVEELSDATVLELNERVDNLKLRGSFPIKSIPAKHDVDGNAQVDGVVFYNVNIYIDNFDVIKRHVCDRMEEAGFDLVMDIEKGMFISYNISVAKSSFLPFVLFSMLLVFLSSVSLYYK